MKKELVPPFPIPFFDQVASLASAINIPANERVAADLSAEWAGGGGGRGGGKVNWTILGTRICGLRSTWLGLGV